MMMISELEIRLVTCTGIDCTLFISTKCFALHKIELCSIGGGVSSA